MSSSRTRSRSVTGGLRLDVFNIRIYTARMHVPVINENDGTCMVKSVIINNAYNRYHNLLYKVGYMNVI